MKLQNRTKIFCLVMQTLLINQAFAIGVYEAPCRFQVEASLDAKRDLNTCIDHLDQLEDEKDNSPRCLAELKAVNEKAKQLHDCRKGN